MIMFKATIGGKKLCLGPQVVALIILYQGIFLLMEPIYEMEGNVIVDISIEISTGSKINKGLHHVVRISIGTPIGGPNTAMW